MSQPNFFNPSTPFQPPTQFNANGAFGTSEVPLQFAASVPARPSSQRSQQQLPMNFQAGQDLLMQPQFLRGFSNSPYERNPNSTFGGSSSTTTNSSNSAKILSKAERRAEHNAIERARRESLNVKFQQLAFTLPNLQNDTRPSKSTIIDRTLDFVKNALLKEERYQRRISELEKFNSYLLSEADKRLQKKRARKNSTFKKNATDAITEETTTAASPETVPEMVSSSPMMTKKEVDEHHQPHPTEEDMESDYEDGDEDEDFFDEEGEHQQQSMELMPTPTASSSSGFLVKQQANQQQFGFNQKFSITDKSGSNFPVLPSSVPAFPNFMSSSTSTNSTATTAPASTPASSTIPHSSTNHWPTSAMVTSEPTVTMKSEAPFFNLQQHPSAMMMPKFQSAVPGSFSMINVPSSEGAAMFNPGNSATSFSMMNNATFLNPHMLNTTSHAATATGSDQFMHRH